MKEFLEEAVWYVVHIVASLLSAAVASFRPSHVEKRYNDFAVALLQPALVRSHLSWTASAATTTLSAAAILDVLQPTIPRDAEIGLMAYTTWVRPLLVPPPCITVGRVPNDTEEGRDEERAIARRAGERLLVRATLVDCRLQIMCTFAISPPVIHPCRHCNVPLLIPPSRIERQT